MASKEALELLEMVLLDESERWQYRYNKIIQDKRKAISNELSTLKKETDQMAKDIEKMKKDPSIDVDEKEYQKKLIRQSQLISQLQELPVNKYNPDGTYGLDAMSQGTKDKGLQKEYRKILNNNQSGVAGKNFDGSFIAGGKDYTPMGKLNKNAKEANKKKDLNYQINKNTKNPGSFVNVNDKKEKKNITKEIKQGLGKEVPQNWFEKLKSKFKGVKDINFIEKLKNLFKGKTQHEAAMILTEALYDILND